MPTPEQTAEAPRTEASAIRKFLLSRGNSAVADGIFHALIVLCALSIFGIVILIATELVLRSDLAWSKFGLNFFFHRRILIPEPAYQAIGIRSTATLAHCRLFTGRWSRRFFPFDGGSACDWAGDLSDRDVPGALRGPLAFLTELLAAIPSIIYGLWAVFVLVPFAPGACESVSD